MNQHSSAPWFPSDPSSIPLRCQLAAYAGRLFSSFRTRARAACGAPGRPPLRSARSIRPSGSPVGCWQLHTQIVGLGDHTRSCPPPRTLRVCWFDGRRANASDAKPHGSFTRSAAVHRPAASNFSSRGGSLRSPALVYMRFRPVDGMYITRVWQLRPPGCPSTRSPAPRHIGLRHPLLSAGMRQNVTLRPALRSEMLAPASQHSRSTLTIVPTPDFHTMQPMFSTTGVAVCASAPLRPFWRIARGRDANCSTTPMVGRDHVCRGPPCVSGRSPPNTALSRPHLKPLRRPWSLGALSLAAPRSRPAILTTSSGQLGHVGDAALFVPCFLSTASFE